MSLSSLPDVLLQLVCQQLDLASLLSFARCCRATIASASSPFAWSQLPPVSVCSAQPDLSGCMARSLIRLCPRLTLIVVSAGAGDETPRVERWKAHSSLLSSLPQLHTLDILDCDPIPLNDLIAAASVLRSLRVLHLPNVSTEDFSLAALTVLTELSLACNLCSQQLHSLQHLPELRLLSLLSRNDVGYVVSEGDLAALSKCTRLEHLTLRWFNLEHLPLVITARMHRLHSLTLIGIGLSSHRVRWAHCLNSAHQLCSFSIYAARPYHALMLAIATEVDPAGPLRRLLIHPMAAIDPATCEPLVDSTRTLLQRLPLLQRLELSLSQSVPVPASFQSRHKHQYLERCLDLHLSSNSKASIDLLIASHNAAFERAAAENRQRVFIVTAPIVLGGAERDAQLRARIQAQSKKDGRCAVMTVSMPLTTLHAVELQLICHSLDIQSILQLARCCRFTLAAASNAFAFHCCPPLSVCSLQPDLPADTPRSLIRFVGVNVRWLRPSPAKRSKNQSLEQFAAEEAKAFETRLQSLMANPFIRGLDTDSHTAVRLPQLISLPFLCQLRVLRLELDRADSSKIQLQVLTELRELHLTFYPSVVLHSLPQMPHLRSLEFALYGPAIAADTCKMMFSPIGDCLSLRRLTMLWFPPAALAAALSARLTQLRFLTVSTRATQGRNVAGVPDELAAAETSWFASINLPPKLRSFSILSSAHTGRHLSALLDSIHPAGPLRHILIQPHIFHAIDQLPDLTGRLPLVRSIQLEMCSLVPVPANPLIQRGPTLAVHARDTIMAISDCEFITDTLRLRRQACEQYATRYPDRVRVIDTPVMPTRSDDDDRWRVRWAAPPPPAKGCCCIC